MAYDDKRNDGKEDPNKNGGGKRPDEKGYNIVVNGKEKIVKSEELSFYEIVHLAFPNLTEDQAKSYVVKFENAGGREPNGSLTNGEGKVKLQKEGTVFRVANPTRS